MKEFLGEICADNFCAVLTISTKCVLGVAKYVIPSTAKSIEAEFIVMGTKGATGLKEVLLSSNTASIVELTECPLAIIPVDATYKTPKVVALATDDKPIEDATIVDPIVNLSANHGAKLVQFSVVRSESEESVAPTQVKEKTAAQKNFTVSDEVVKVHDEDIEHGILEYCDDSDVDVLAVIHHEHDFFDRLIHRSMAKKLAMHSEVPLIILQG